MKAQLKTDWLNGLRSGAYAQGHVRMRNQNDTYCCLGVLCDVSKVGNWDCVYGKNYYIENESKERSGGIPDTNLAHLLGINDEEVGELWRMNDMDRKSFTEIADWIEENIHVD